VWIETSKINLNTRKVKVTPFAGVWIETELTYSGGAIMTSLLLRECGLKRR